jgi:predicted thioesterase
VLLINAMRKLKPATDLGHILSDMADLIPEIEVLDRIDVGPPYYALRDVRRTAMGGIEADISATLELGAEIGPIAAADASRHMAIAGSVSAALDNPANGVHMYLAYDAEFRRARQSPPEDVREFTVSASHQWIDESTVQATTVLRTNEGVPVNTLSTYFMVLRKEDFFGFFADHQAGTPGSGEDPYLDVVRLEGVVCDSNRLTASLGTIDPASCVGHFDGLPAMPVAYLMGNIVSASGRLLKQILNADTLQFSVREGSVRAEALAFAGEQVDIQVEYQRFSGGTYWFHAKALVGDDKVVGALHTKLRVREPTSVA